MATQTLVSISGASQVLGVSAATLRLWTDEGRIKAFITPGGHRRYSLDELRRFVSSQHRALGIRGLARELAQTGITHREIAHSFPRDDWYRKLTPEQNQRLLALGRGLIDLVIKYLTVPAKREETLRLARQNGEEHGIILAQVGLSLTDSVGTFIQHRGHVMRSIAGLMGKNAVQSKRVTESLPLVTQIIDEVLLAMIDSHQKTFRTKSSPADGDSES